MFEAQIASLRGNQIFLAAATVATLRPVDRAPWAQSEIAIHARADAVAMGRELAASPPAVAQSDPKVINDPTRLDWDYYGSGYALKPIRDPAIPGGGAAVEIAVKKGRNAYDAGTNVPIGAIVEGRDYVVRFWARTLKSSASGGKGRLLVRFVGVRAGF